VEGNASLAREPRTIYCYCEYSPPHKCVHIVEVDTTSKKLNPVWGPVLRSIGSLFPRVMHEDLNDQMEPNASLETTVLDE